MTANSLHRRSFLRTLAAGAAGASLLRPFEAAAEAVRTQAESIAFRGDSNDSVHALAERYMLDPNILYVNHASIGTMPRAVHVARVSYLALCEENPWLYMWGGAWEQAREDARTALAEMLGAVPGNMAITHNTTEGFNLLAAGLPLGPGDEVLYTSLNHDGGSVCFDHWSERRGYTVREVDFPLASSQDVTAESLIEFHRNAIRPNTRVLVLPHIDNMVGLRAPLAEICAMAHQEGVEFVAVDGAQTAGMIPLDLDASGVDAYAGSPHKWLQAPKGLGLLYLRPSLQEQLDPMWMTWGQARWSDSVRRFEDYGTRNLAETVALNDALTFQRALNEDQKQIRLRATWQRLYDRVDSTGKLLWRSPRRWEDSGALVGVEVVGAAAPEVGSRLQTEHGVIMRTFGGTALNTVRISPHVINTDEELDRLCDLLEASAP